uniref:Uncharacterized protein n=1 Tax=Oryza meridionalis TaxID=40149 RepID=A0A0E0EQY4_9ORYZ
MVTAQYGYSSTFVVIRNSTIRYGYSADDRLWTPKVPALFLSHYSLHGSCSTNCQRGAFDSPSRAVN